jgi:hypothetical protein
MPNTKNLSFSHTSKFRLSFPFLPFLSTQTDTEKGDSVLLYCDSVTLPGITNTAINIEVAGYHDFKLPNSDIQYGTMSITYHVDELFSNYEMLYRWMMYMKDPERWGAGPMDGMVNASLHIYTNNDNPKFAFTLVNFWPIGLGPLSFSKKDTSGDDLEHTATFTMDYWKLERL